MLSYTLYDRFHQIYSYDSLFQISLHMHYTQLRQLPMFDFYLTLVNMNEFTIYAKLYIYNSLIMGVSNE